MKSRNQNLGLWLAGAVLIAGVLPLFLYWPAFTQPVPSGALSVRNVGLFEQWLLVITAFGVKPAYMLLSLLWILWLRRSQAADLVALRWGLTWFLGGELACAVNYVVFAGCSAIADYLHSFGMAVGFSFIAYAVLEGVDFRLIKYSPAKDRCAALSLCRSCIKYADVPCGLRRLFVLLIPTLMAVALMLPCASLKAVAHRTNILNSVQEYWNPMWSQLFEGRYCAWVSILLLLASWVVLSFKRENPVAAAKIFFAAAMGPLGFGFMRLFLRTAYAEDLVWSNIWEELTELIFVLGVGFVLWLFRQALFAREPSAAADRVPAG